MRRGLKQDASLFDSYTIIRSILSAIPIFHLVNGIWLLKKCMELNTVVGGFKEGLEMLVTLRFLNDNA